MVIKVYNSQVGVSKQSSFVETAKLNSNFGQAAFQGQQLLAEGVKSIEDYQAKQKELDKKNTIDETVNKSLEELIALESEMYDVEGIYTGVPTSEKESLFIKKREEIIGKNTTGLNLNLKTEIKNKYQASSINIVRTFSNAQNGIIKDKALGNALENIQNTSANIDFSNPANVVNELLKVNEEMEFLFNAGLINSESYLELKDTTVSSVLSNAIKQTAANIGYADFEDVLNGENIDYPILSNITGLLNNDEAALNVYDTIITQQINEFKNRDDLFTIKSNNWELDNQQTIQNLNSNNLDTRKIAVQDIQEAFNLNLINQDKYNSYLKVINASGAFATNDNLNKIMTLQSELSTGTLTRTDLANIDRSLISQTTYDSFYAQINAADNLNEGNIRQYAYSTFGVETGMLDPDNTDHQAISGVLKKIDGDLAQWRLGDFTKLSEEYGQDITKMSFEQFGLLAVEVGRKQSRNIRLNYFMAKIKQINSALEGEFVNSIKPIDFRNYNKWEADAIANGLNPDDAIYARSELNMYSDFLDGISE